MLKGVRIDAIGLQYHLFNKAEVEYEKTRTTLNPKSLYKHMDLYAHLGKPLQVTEITVPAYSWEQEDEEIQAEIIEKLYAIWFSHPSVEQIVYWNLVDGYAHLWDPDLEKIKASQGNMTLGENVYYGGLMRFDLSKKPAYDVIRRLFNEKWRTEATVVTDAEGNACFRGFFGDYGLEIELPDRTVTESISLRKASENKSVLQV
jgi:GH35 family endo-1,4-beta-xylanase